MGVSSINLSHAIPIISYSFIFFPFVDWMGIYQVPFLDVCNTLLDPSLPLTILDYEEFGNPQIRSNFDSIFSYSPYDNIPEGSCFPSVLVTAAVNDSRQSYSCPSSIRCIHIS